MDFIGTLGRGSVVGVLLGVLLNIWVRPITTEGQILLVLLTIAICVVVTAVIRLVLFSRRTGDPDE
ncbi:MAG: hypothetical protein AAGI36_16540 [Pseudomonadota bacterium]